MTEQGKSDGVFISTTGIGFARESLNIHGAAAEAGDAVLLSGSIGNHGIAVAEARGNLGFKSQIRSDVAPLNGLIAALLEAVPEVHVLRDPTRGGLATTLVEIACQSSVTIQLDEESIPIDRDVKSACDLLGLDPLYMANEGILIALLPAEKAELALATLRSHPYGSEAVLIGKVTGESDGQLLLKTPLGTTRRLDMLAGEMLPRIC